MTTGRNVLEDLKAGLAAMSRPCHRIAEINEAYPYQRPVRINVDDLHQARETPDVLLLDRNSAGLVCTYPALWIGRTWCDDHPAPVVNVGRRTIVKPMRIGGTKGICAALWTHEAPWGDLSGFEYLGSPDTLRDRVSLAQTCVQR